MHSDEELMHAVLERDRKAFQALVTRWKQPLMAYFYRHLQQREICEDLVQEVLFKVWKTSRYQNQGQFKAWLFRLAHNTRVDWLRRNRRVLQHEVTGLDNTPEQRHPAPEPEEQVLSLEQQDDLAQALVALPDKQRELLILSRFHELNHSEIAEITQRSRNTVKVQVFRALKQLAKKFKEVHHAGVYLMLTGLAMV